jgi:DNA-binding transcriptional MerR regulator
MLTDAQIKTMRNNGMTLGEIRKIDSNLKDRPQKIDLDIPEWQQVFRDRLNFIDRMTRKGMSLDAIYDMINTYIEAVSKNGPWDFIKEIGSGVKGEKKSDFKQRMEATRRVKDYFGNDYKTPRRRYAYNE